MAKSKAEAHFTEVVSHIEKEKYCLSFIIAIIDQWT